MNKLCKAVTATVAGAALALTPVLSGPALAAPPAKCEFRLGTVRAIDLNHDNGSDFIFMRVGQVWGPSGTASVEFTAGNMTATPAEFAPADRVTFTDEIEVSVNLDLLLTNPPVDTTTFPCATIPPTEKKFESSNGKIEYHVGYSVAVVP